MSTDPTAGRSGAPTRRGRSRRRRSRAFLGAFAIVVGALAVLGVAAAVVSVVQGPRVTAVQVDPDAAVTASGSRLIVTTSQSLSEVEPSQVRVEPAIPFAVDTSGRSIGIRFAQPLWDDTAYTVTIDDVRGLGGGPASTIVEAFDTPAIDVHLMQRDADGDTIFRTDLTGEEAVPVFTHPHIEDFRATSSHLVVSVRTDDDRPALIVTDLDGNDERELRLPDEDGIVSALQASDRGEVVGYTFTDASARIESALFTASVSADAADAEPTPIEVGGADPRIAEWRFVPDTDSILLLGFDGTLLLAGSDGGEATSLGTAVAIDGVAGTTAIVERVDGTVVVDLTDASESPLVEADAELGMLDTVLPLAGAGTLRTFVELDADALRSEGTNVSFVDDDGASGVIAEVAPTDALVQSCVSPSGRYAALLVAPDAVENVYDSYLLPLPARLETRIVEVADGASVVDLAGFDVSWCRVPPA